MNSTTRKPAKEADRLVTRKGDQLVARLRDPADRKDFEQRLLAKCHEAGLAMPSLVPFGPGMEVAIACKSRDHAIFVLDFAQEAIAEMQSAKDEG